MGDGYNGSESAVAHKHFDEWKLHHTRYPQEDYAKLDLKVLNTLEEFKNISDPPSNERIIKKLEKNFLEDDRTQQVYMALKAADKIDFGTTDAKSLIDKVYETFKLTNIGSPPTQQVALFAEKGTCFFESQAPGGCRKGGSCTRSHNSEDLKKLREVLEKKKKAKNNGGDGQVCTVCSKKGHLAKDCFKAVSNRVCYNCKEKGHMAKSCPKPSTKQQPRQQQKAPQQEIKQLAQVAEA